MVELANNVLDQLSVEDYVMLAHRDNWADEIDTEGFILMTTTEWEAIQETIKHADTSDFSEVYGVGTNEQLDMPTDAEGVINMYNVKPVPKDTYTFLMENLANEEGRFGIIPHPLELIDEY